MSRHRDEDESAELQAFHGPPPFRPKAIDLTALRADVHAHMRALLPDGVDDATPYVLDDFINRRIRAELADLLRDWTYYLDEVLMPHQIEARAVLAYEEVVNDTQQQLLAEYRLGRDAAVDELRGDGRPSRRLWRHRREDGPAQRAQKPEEQP